MPPFWVTGRHPVEEILAAGVQPVTRILVADAVPADVVRELAARAEKARVPVSTCGRDAWEKATGEREGSGIGALLPEDRYATLPEWIGRLPEGAGAFLLDGVTDPQNFGAVLRSARAFGLSGVVISRDRSCPVTAAVYRASAGAAAHLPVVAVTNLARAMEELKEAGFWIYAAEARGEIDAAAWEPARRTAVVLGSEEKGIRRLVRERCDGGVRIPMVPGVDSLNVSVTAGILGFRLFSDRRTPEGGPRTDR